MASSLGPIDVCNMALSQIGSRAQITSISPSDGTQAGDACALLYQPTVDSFARAAHWNCCRFSAALSLIKAAAGTPENPNGTTLPVTPLPWLYEYALPADCLKARFLVPGISAQPLSPPLTGGSIFLPTYWAASAVPFVVSADLDQDDNEIAVLLTNIGTANSGPPQLVYTRRLVNIGLWDAQFLMGAKAALGAWLVNPMSASAAMMTQAMGIAKAMLDAARISDGNEGPISEDHTPDWIRVRGGGGGGSRSLAFIAPWDAFAFPGGAY